MALKDYDTQELFDEIERRLPRDYLGSGTHEQLWIGIVWHHFNSLKDELKEGA